jgi:hypothetical protein
MLDAFIALLIVLAFVSTLSSFNRDYSYVQDEALYSQGRNIMDVLLYTTIKIENRGEVPLIHALKLSEGKNYWNENVKGLIPENLNYSIEYYDVDQEKWISFGSTYDTLEALEADDEYYKKSIAVISSIPIVTRNEEIKAPYTYPDTRKNMCAESIEVSDSGDSGSSVSSNTYEHVCALQDKTYVPDVFNSDFESTDSFVIGMNAEAPANYHAAFVRVLVKI